MSQYFSSTCGRNMSQYGQILLEKQCFLLPSDFDLQYIISIY